MTFQPRTHENGGNCCCDYTKDWEPLPPTNPCPKCLEHFAALGVNLRTAASTTLTTVEVVRRLGLQLARVDQGYMRVVDADVEKGTGTFEARANGKTVTKSFTFDIVDGTTVVLLSPAMPTAVTAAEEHGYAPPDLFAAGLAKLRAATATDASRFEDEYKATRLRELAAEHARIDAHLEAHPSPRLTAAEAAEYRPPDIYAAGIRALQEKKR